jgi:leucyl-tRNA synthetase
MVMDRSETVVNYLLNERILAGTKKTEDKKNQDKPFFEMLVFNKHQEVREMTEQILTKATKYLYNRLEELATYESAESLAAVREPLNTIIDTVTSMMPLECMKAWHKLGAYFQFLHNLVKDGNAKAISDLNERKTVSKLVGLVTRFKDQ